MQQLEKQSLILRVFIGIFMKLKKKGTGFAVGNLTEKINLIRQGKAYLQPVTIKGQILQLLIERKRFLRHR